MLSVNVLFISQTDLKEEIDDIYIYICFDGNWTMVFFENGDSE